MDAPTPQQRSSSTFYPGSPSTPLIADSDVTVKAANRKDSFASSGSDPADPNLESESPGFSSASSSATTALSSGNEPDVVQNSSPAFSHQQDLQWALISLHTPRSAWTITVDDLDTTMPSDSKIQVQHVALLDNDAGHWKLETLWEGKLWFSSFVGKISTRMCSTFGVPSFLINAICRSLRFRLIGVSKSVIYTSNSEVMSASYGDWAKWVTEKICIISTQIIF